jgi:hypothetical protein
MKLIKIIGVLCLVWLMGIPSLQAQVQSTTASSAKSKSYGYTLQVGVPYRVPQSATQSNYSIRFPWEVMYLNGTFSSQLEVSKGYFSDKIQLQWEVTNNYSVIRSFKIYRKPLGSEVYEKIANVSSTVTSYEDVLVNGGELYEYKLVATGVMDEDVEINLGNTITGIGYRNPTAVVSGRVTYEGGGPVANVKVNANPEGAIVSLGSSVLLGNDKQLTTFLDPVKSPIKETIMLQAWVKPTQANGQNTTLFTLKDNVGGAKTVTVNTQNNKLTVSIAGKVFVLENHFPKGEVDDKGIEQFYDIAALHTQFTHFSVGMQNNSIPTLSINGRAITATYIDDVKKQYNNDPSYFAASIPSGALILANNINAIELGGSTAAFYIDEFRLWNATLADETIQKDFLRYIDGNHKNLMAYYRMDEAAGSYLYDLSRTGSVYHKNNTNLNTAIQWEKGITAVPSAQQFGILGITDAQGYYTITAIPYSGSGESFRITPLYGQHQFDPNQQSVYLGKGSEVVNKLDFVDKSSFNFNGIVRFDTRGVFESINDANSPAVSLGSAPLEGYNSYKVGDDTYEKGEFWYNETESEIRLYPEIGLKGANIYIDGQIVLDDKNKPKETNAEGVFNIQVPIGKHIITVSKKGHTLLHEGNYPATGEHAFFENRDDVVTFIDSSRVTLVGKVVGGSIEAGKTIGFGEENKIREGTYFEGSSTIGSKVRISAKNNIGIAAIALGYKPPSGSITPKTTFNFTTDAKTGEYRVSVLPLEYTITENDVKVNSNTTIKLLTGSEQLNLVEIKALITPEFTMPDANETLINGEPYQYVKSFVHRSIPELTVLAQTNETELTIGDKTISTTGFEVNSKAVYVYKQFGLYAVKMQSIERYVNNDATTAIEDIVPIIDGELSITNNLALPNSEFKCTNDQLEGCYETDSAYKSLIDNLKNGDNPSDQSIRYYAFKGGFPTITAPFTKTIDINLVIKKVSYPATAYLTEGVLLGGKSDGSQTFVTEAPDVPDIILRDPPGSNSSASIEKGETFSFSTEASISAEIGIGSTTKISTGVTFELGGGLAGPVVKAEVKADVETGISVTNSAEGSFSTKTTYAFDQTISTSDAPEFVGAEADLYIGKSKNFFYGSYNDVSAYAEEKENSINYPLRNDKNETIFISLQKAMSFVEEPSSTFFVYSQHYIRNTLIPEIQLIIQNIDNEIISEDDKGVLKKQQYEQQVNLWRKIILQNEKTKYEAIHDKRIFLNNILALNSIFSDEFISDEVYKNISFDAGLGEITRSLESSKEVSEKLSYKLEVEKSIKESIGAEVNDTGFEIALEQKAKLGLGYSEEEGKEVKSAFSYTLKDNDLGNFLSVDVVNAFDGNGPIFSTKGGRTSCPYEGPSMSYFYNPDTYDQKADTIHELAEDNKVQLSYATQRTEKPKISVTVKEVFDVQDSDNAEFTLILENLGEAANTYSDFLLQVDNTTNPDNAIINLPVNGAVVNVPAGQQTIYQLTLKKSIQKVDHYEGIRIKLESLCEVDAKADVIDDIFISAHFVPACSIVEVAEPKDNWVFNRTVSKFTGESVRNPLSIKLGAYNKNYSNFSRMQLQFRLSTSSTWSNLHTYYKNQVDLDLALTNGSDASTLSLISTVEANNQVSYDWYLAGKKDGDIPLQDGNYEVRAISYCSNDTQYVSAVTAGKVDFTSPRRFASPEPTNGILNAGDDIKVSFNEDVFYNSAISQIEISGRSNQLPIDDNVSLQFNGAASFVTIEKPDISSGDITFEWWMLNKTPLNTAATILKQANNLEIGLTASNEIYFELAGKRIKAALGVSDLFHHFAFTYREIDGYMGIYQDDKILIENQYADLIFDSNENVTIGKSAFQGNLHSLRLWDKYISSTDSGANMRMQTLGNEANLLGFWSMQEGKGTVAKDLARFKHASVTASWDIKPKGESYAFTGANYLVMDKAGFVFLNKEMDATISFWMKANSGKSGTLFSNGKGDGTDLDQANGGDGKWAVIVDPNKGKLQFLSEGYKFNLTEVAINDGAWHHVAIVLNRLGSLNTYLDGEKVSTLSPKGIGGFSGNNIWFGTRGFTDQTGVETFSDNYTGLLDEFRFWNTARTKEQLFRDQYSEINKEQLGLVFYTRLNAATDGSNTPIPPTYTRLIAGNKVEGTSSKLSPGSTVSYSTETPALLPQRPLTKFIVNHVINQDEMILEPQVTDWASLEGQILDITVHRMYDALGNEQNSPITWTAFINKNDVSWFADKANDGLLEIVKLQAETNDFSISLINRGGKSQPYEITNIPNWLSLSKTSGVLSPNSSFVINASVSNLVATGSYFENLHLKTDFGFDKLLKLNLRVLEKAPDWTIDPTDFNYSMNIIGQIKVDGVLSDDKYDMIAAFDGNELRGVTTLKNQSNVDKWLAYFTIYSNSEENDEQLSFKMWDASKGVVLVANIDGESSIKFESNKVLGKLSSPKIFNNSGIVEQKISFSSGWTWVSLNVDRDFSDLSKLTSGMILETDDRIVSHLVGFDSYSPSDTWSGGVTKDGGLKNTKMYKVFTTHQQALIIKGSPVDIDNWIFPIQTNWNWVPYPLLGNQLTNEALAYLDATDGDVIKSQSLFAIYDPIIGWNGTLNYLESGKGYMIKSNKDQAFSYPSYLSQFGKMNTGKNLNSSVALGQETISLEFTKYAENMNAVVSLPQGYDELFVYDAKGVLKGASENQDVNNKALSFITVYGDISEELVFYIGDGINKKRTSKNFSFKGNDVLGTIAKPIIIEDSTDNVTIYPNPFDNEMTIKVNAVSDQIVSIQLYSLTGQIVLDEKQDVLRGENIIKILPRVASGAYLLQIEINGEKVINKVMKN